MDYKDVLEKYEKTYHNKQFICKTSYKPIEEFVIKFNILQLPHLLGLHKVYSSNPKMIIEKINKGRITKKKIRHNSQYGDVNDRINCCDFLDAIFSEDSKTVIYLAEVDKRNSMRLDLVFYEPFKNKLYVLGLRKAKGVYVPTTFYLEKSTRKQFMNSKRVKIKEIRKMN